MTTTRTVAVVLGVLTFACVSPVFASEITGTVGTGTSTTSGSSSGGSVSGSTATSSGQTTGVVAPPPSRPSNSGSSSSGSGGGGGSILAGSGAGGPNPLPGATPGSSKNLVQPAAPSSTSQQPPRTAPTRRLAQNGSAAQVGSGESLTASGTPTTTPGIPNTGAPQSAAAGAAGADWGIIAGIVLIALIVGGGLWWASASPGDRI